MAKWHFSKNQCVTWSGVVGLTIVVSILVSALTNRSLTDYSAEVNKVSKPLEIPTTIFTSPQAYQDRGAASAHMREVADESLAIIYKGKASNVGFTRDQIVATGVVVTSDGWIFLPSLPAIGKESLHVQIKDRIYTVESVTSDPLTEVVFVKTNASNRPVVSFESAYNMQSGDEVFQVEAKTAFYRAVIGEVPSTQGVTLLSEALPTAPKLHEPSSNPSLVFTTSGAFLGFVPANSTSIIPVSGVLPAWNTFLQSETMTRPLLGIQFIDLTQAIGREEGGSRVGVLVMGVRSGQKGAPAREGGVQVGDIIRAIDGRVLEGRESVNNVLLETKPGQTVSLEIERSGERKTIQITLGEWAP